MKQVTATEARKQWFRLLDEVVSGEVVILERKGRRVILRREDSKRGLKDPKELDYRKLLRVPDADHADCGVPVGGTMKTVRGIFGAFVA